MTDRILVVDDDRSILALVHEILEDAEYDVRSTSDPVEGLGLVEQERPDLVVLDMRMPVLDGWGFKRELDARGMDTPIVVMTAAQNARRWAQEIGAIGYLAKPFDIDELLRVVDVALTEAGARGAGTDSTGTDTATCSIDGPSATGGSPGWQPWAEEQPAGAGVAVRVRRLLTGIVLPLKGRWQGLEGSGAA